MNGNQHNLSTQKWPGTAWINWLQISWTLYTVIVVLIVLMTGWDITIHFWETGNMWLAVWESNWFSWAIYGLMGWSYWQYRLQGKKPSVSTNNQKPFLSYLDRTTRKLFWRALLDYQHNGKANLGMEDLFQVFVKHQGGKLTCWRLNLTSNDIQVLLSESSEPATKALAQAFILAAQAQTPIDWSHLLKGIIMSSSNWAQLLKDKKIKLAEALAVVDWAKKDLGYRNNLPQSSLLRDLFVPRKNLNKTWTAKATPVLDRFSQSLTELAKLGYLTSARVRQTEVEQAIQVLSKSQQNSFILVGEPGVGKTAIVGDIALRMLKGDIPALADYKLISLDVGALIGASTNNFQQLFSQAIQEAASSGNTILFIGNLDQLGKAKSEEGFGLSAILLDALQNNHLQLIGTADPLNYKKYIENDSNLMNWFSRVNVTELDADEAVLVLEDLSSSIENRQGVLITLSAIKTAVQLSQQYIHTGKLPDKAEDLLDEATVYASRRHIGVVTDKEVGIVMSSKTNVPIGEIDKTEKDKLANLGNLIHERLIGQNEAVVAVVEALQRTRLGVSASGKRPIGTFLFLGPTGVGKTELAKSLAWGYFGDESKIIRLDMGEYQTRESVHNLLGAPMSTGDIALAGGSFTEKVKQTPFAVVLLDEIEKAHDEILNVFLRVLDEGKMTDNLGNEVDFTHTIIIATSNAEARYIEEAVNNKTPYKEVQAQLTQKLTQTEFKPEFINRFDGIIVFKPLTKAEIMQIAHLKINQLQERLKVNKNINLQITDDAIKALVDKGYNPAFGARPLERLIREKVETKVASTLLANESVDQVIVDRSDIVE